MACTYTINGRQYNDVEVKQVFSSILSVPGNENLTNDQLVEKIRELTKDRFVDINLFNPYQETAYTNVIFSEVINRLGVLKPGEEIRLKPNALFAQIRAAFTNDFKRLNFLAETAGTEQKYNELRDNEAIVAKYPEVSSLTYDQLKSTVEQFKNIIDPENFSRFVDMARVKLGRLGLRISDNKIEDYGLSYEYFMAMAEEDSADTTEDITEDERQMDESFEDGRAFRINVKDTASTRVKLFFSSVPNTEKNIFGKNDFVPYDQVFEDLLQIGSASTKLNYHSLQKALLEKSQVKPYLRNVANKLAQLQQDKNVGLLNEIMTVINKAFTDHVLVLWNSGGDSGVTVKIISSNRDSVINQIKQDWLENQKRSEIISKDDLGELVINKQRVAQLAEELKNVNKSKEAKEKIFFVQEFFKAVGIEFTPKMIDHLKSRANSGFFRMMGSGSFTAMFRPNGVFDRILKTYAKEPEGKTAVKYDDINNAMLHERAFGRFAEIYFEFHGDKYQTGSFRNGENKTIYSYINPSYLETVKKKLSAGKEFLDQLASRSFSKSSEVVEELTKNLGKETGLFTFRIRYADSLKRDKEDKDAKVRKHMSPKEMVFDAIIKHQNGAATAGFYNMFTLSDKTVTPVIEMTKDSLTTGVDVAINKNDNTRLRDSFNFKQGFSQKLYRLAESEINRILDYANYDNKAELGINLFEKSSKLFYLFPVLNSREDSELTSIRNKMLQGQLPTEADKEYLATVLTKSFKDSVLDSFVKMVDDGIIVKREVFDSTTGQTVINFEYPYFNDDYMKRFQNLSSRHKGIMAIADFKFNYLRAQINSLQVLGADPALFYTEKINKLAGNKDYDQLTTADIEDLVIATMDEFGKRAAMFIAPGSQGVWEWLDMNGAPVDKTSYDTITLADVIKDTAAFKKVNLTDAEELITVQEHIDRLMSEGRMPLENWQKITDKIKKAKGKFYKLEADELDLVLQPTKPVQSSNTDKDGFTKIDYVKSSTYPLIPEVLHGTELDKFRSYMEKNNISSANFESAKKTGIPAKPIQVFDPESGDFIKPTLKQMKSVRQTLSREGLRTQQEIPAQKSEINVVSQMDRQLFEGLLDVKNFSLAGKSFTGRQLKNFKENIRIALFYKNQEELEDRLNIKVQNGKVIFKDQRALANLLQEEALERDFDLNDIKAIKVNKEGNLVIPIYLMAKGKKFEGLVTSIFSKLVKLKVPGTSLVQVSGVGTKTTRLEENELTDKVKNEIIYTQAYDPAKGLQYIRKNKKGVEAAQVFISQYLRDENGKLINIKEMATQDSSGRWVLDPSKLDATVLQLISARIPNQGHSSMLPIEVAGFLPDYMENTVIVPDGITAQMGSDFDVDKLYAYISVLNYKYSDETTNRIKEINEQITQVKKDYDIKVSEAFDAVLPKNVRKTIEELKAKKNKYVEKLKYVGLSQAEKDKKQKRIDGINKILEEVYTSAMQGTNEEKFKIANQQKYTLREQLAKDLEKLRDELTGLQAKVEGIGSYQYDVSKYQDTYESLIGLSDSELLQMYKDLHWSVLTNPATFNKITKSIDFTDIKDEIKVFEENGLVTKPLNYIPMDFESQIQNFIDNRSGKQGTGIFAQLISFLAEHQDKNVYAGKITSDGRKVATPIQLLKDDNSALDLYKLTEEGKSETPFGVRTKTDNTSIMLSESVDNTKNKNLYKFDFSVEAMTPLRALISLSSEDGEIADMRYATRLFPQQIITEYIGELESRRDSLNDNTYVNKQALASEIRGKYLSLMSERSLEEYEMGKLPVIKFSPEKLLNALIDGKSFGRSLMKNKLAKKKLTPEDQDKLDQYLLTQISVMELYEQLDELGQGLSSLMNASNVISSGVGSSLFAVADKQRRIGQLAYADGKTFVNLQEILGTVTEDGDIIDPKGQAGHAMSVAVDFGVKVLSQLAPLHFSPVFNDLRSKVVRERSASGFIRNYGKQKYITLSEDLMNNLNAYIFTNPEFGIVEDVNAERQRLLFGTKEEDPLALRIEKAKTTHPFLNSNYFINRLRLVIPSKSKYSDPYLVEYRAPFSQDIDELSNNKGFLELILSGDDTLINIARDLMKYPYVTGYNQGYSSYIRYIPVELFMLNTKYMDAMQKFPSMLNNRGSFYKQFIQNNPTYARRIPWKIYKSLFMAKLAEDAVITLNSSKITEAELDNLKVTMGPEEGTGKKLPDYLSYYDRKANQWMLFQKQGLDSQDLGVESMDYKRIGTLGNGVISEYSITTDGFQSIFFNNLLYNEKFDRISSSATNPYRGLKLGNIDLYRRQIAMADVATQMIGENINGKGTIMKNNLLAFKDRTNTGQYLPTDVVMITGNSLTDVTPLQDEQTSLDAMQTAETYKVLETVFEKSYKPLIDAAIAAGSDLLVTNTSGMDQVVRKYLEDKKLSSFSTEMGYDRYSSSIKTEPATLDEDFDVSEEPMDFNMNLADIDVPTVDLFGTGEPALDDPLVEEAGAGLFGLEFTTDEETVVPTPDEVDIVSEPSDVVMTNDADIVKMYVGKADKPAALKTVLTKLGKNTDNEFYKTLTKVFEKTGYPDTTIVINDSIVNPGEYDMEQDVIIINPQVALNDVPSRTRKENFEDVLMHEVIHGYTVKLIDRAEKGDKSLSKEQRMYIASLKQLYREVVGKVIADPEHAEKLKNVIAKLDANAEETPYLTPADKSMYYGLTSIYEFTTMLMTDKTFQTFMNDIIVQEAGKVSALERFKRMLVKLFRTLAETLGIQIKSGSALEQGVNDIFNLITQTSYQAPEESTTPQMSLFSTVTRKLENYSLDTQCK